ncbi:unnamed protein product [Parajaminaea phylloscopi]
MHSTAALRRAASSATFTLASGAKIPRIGFGTWKLKPDETTPAVAAALKAGFRHIDSAWAYKNEKATGEAIQKSGVNRNDVWITSKLWNSFHGDNVELGLDATLRDLGTDYLDLYLMHWPVAFRNPKNSELTSLKSQDGRPIENHVLSEDLISTWKGLEEMVKKGKVRNIGISNCNIRRVEQILANADIPPAVNQVEVNWGVPNDELLHYCEAHQVKLQAYSPLGSSDYVQEYSQDPVIVDVAKRNNITPVQTVLAWHLARGILPITRSRDPQRLQEALAATHIELPWADVQHLTREADNKPIQRVVDPTEAWNVKEDIFEDYVDQTRLSSLKGGSLDVPLPHEANKADNASSYLEPRNDPATPLTPNENVARFHSFAGRRTTGTKGSTVLQQLSARRAFTASSRARGTAAPTAAGASSFLSVTPKQALATSGIRWSDGGDSTARDTRKMNMCTYQRLIQDSQFMLLVQPNNLSVAEFSKLRADLAAVPLPEGVQEGSRVRFTVVRSGVLRPALRSVAGMPNSRSPGSGQNASLARLGPLLAGPLAMLTSPSLSPAYVSRILAVIDKALGNTGRAPAAGARTAVTNPRLVPLAAVVEGNKVLDVPALRSVGTLPDLQTLRAQIVGLLSQPAGQLASVLSMAAGGRLALTLEGRKQQLEGDKSDASPSA